MCVYRPNMMIVERTLCLESEHQDVKMDNIHTHISKEVVVDFGW